MEIIFWGMISIMNLEPYQLTAHKASNLISSGSLTSLELVNSCLNQFSKTESSIKAWEYLDCEKVILQALECDHLYKIGKKIGPLHGIPIGIKDIIDTTDMPTNYGKDSHN